MVPPKVLAVSVGRPRDVEWRGHTTRTSIFKTPVTGRVHVGRLNLDGDEQSDLSVHGGPDKAVYVYPSEHYAYWRSELPGVELPFGAFGENLTTEGLLDDAVAIGDRYRIGDAELVVTQPRMPCFKLGIRFQRPDMVKRFHRSRRNGFYLGVTREGTVGAGDAIEQIARDDRGLSVMDVVRLYDDDDPDPTLIRRAIDHPSLPASWRNYFREQTTR
ncbi:MAG TPA: MOSC domain-containing protein [Candidatus Binatia bacterium]|jgi:MOSC domain-containing protein YiiM|nr:MOSC domain-containing protein [Candidatus Binatia bacterium]